MGRATFGAGFAVLALLVMIWIVPQLFIEPGRQGVALACSGVVTALLASILAAVSAAAARRATRRLEADLLLLARSVDMALKDVLSKTEQSATELEAVVTAVRHGRGYSDEIALRPFHSSQPRLDNGFANGLGAGQGERQPNPLPHG